MKIGVSLSPALLLGQAASAHQKRILKDGIEPFLTRLKDAGCTHIELRNIRWDTPREMTEGALHSLSQSGLQMTVHSALSDERPECFWGRLSPLLEAQKDLCVTVHSASTREETIRLLRRMGEYAFIHHPSALLALENNRSRLGDTIDLVECGGVISTVFLTQMNNIGTCWDFGHFCWDRQAHPALLPDALPPEAFLRRAVHTHIHSVYADTTHFPLTMGFLPLADYLRALLRAGYQGVFNFEPEPERWADSIDAAEEIVRSVRILKETMLTVKEDLS